MKRKFAFIIMFVLCTTLGVAASAIVYRFDEKQMYTLAEKQSVATISAPAEIIEAPEENLPLTEEISTSTEVSEETPEPMPQIEESITPTEEIPEQLPQVEEIKAEPKYRFKVKSIPTKLRVRKEPSLQAEVLGHLYGYQTGEVISLSEEWALIKYKDLEGYCSLKYLTLEELPQP